MYRIVVEGKKESLYNGYAEGIAFGYYEVACLESCSSINSTNFGRTISLYHDDYCVRQMVGHIQEAYNLPHTD